MSCYASTTKAIDHDVTWVEYDHFHKDAVYCQLCRVIQQKSTDIDNGTIDWYLIGEDPADDSLADYAWNESAVTPLNAYKTLFVQMRTSIIGIINASYIDEGCVLWRWDDKAALLAMVPSASLANEKEDWLQFVEEMQALLDAMILQVSDAWEEGELKFLPSNWFVEVTQRVQTQGLEWGEIESDATYFYIHFGSQALDNVTFGTDNNIYPGTVSIANAFPAFQSPQGPPPPVSPTGIDSGLFGKSGGVPVNPSSDAGWVVAYPLSGKVELTHVSGFPLVPTAMGGNLASDIVVDLNTAYSGAPYSAAASEASTVTIPAATTDTSFKSPLINFDAAVFTGSSTYGYSGPSFPDEGYIQHDLGSLVTIPICIDACGRYHPQT